MTDLGVTTRLLVDTLQVAVPLWIADHRACGRTQQELVEYAYSTADIVTTNGDILEFRGKHHTWTTAMVFNVLARGLAAAVLLDPPGGVVAFGMHWRERFTRPCTGSGQLDAEHCAECQWELDRDRARTEAVR